MLKVHSRCDLRCDHCYVYEHADQTWRGRPVRMAPATVRAAAKRIAEHAREHELPVVHVVLHGGEPLLLGAAGLREVLAELRAAITPWTRLDLRMQTNGVLLDEELCRVLVDHDVQVGVSFDGDRAANDRHRLFAHGGSSHDQVRRALALLRHPDHRTSYAGILCTIDVRNDPDRVYEALLAERPPRVDLLLPHATWDRPPDRPGTGSTPYADWLGRIYRRWVDEGRPVSIRLFEALAPGGGGTEAFGLAPADVLVVEADGSWEQVDSLKTAYHGAAETGFDVFGHSVDEASRHPGVAVRQTGVDGLCATCRACPVMDRCGGGLYAHRWRTGSGFDNPSVYCEDLLRLIDTVDTYPPPVASAGQGAEQAAPPVDDLLDDLATGYGSEQTLDLLAAAQLSITRALLAAWRERSGQTAAWDLLVDLDAKASDAVRAVLTHPFVRPWLVHRLVPSARPGASRAADPLPAIALAAALRAGCSATVDVPVRSGVLALPTLGSLVLPVAVDGTVEVTVLPDGFRVRGGPEDQTVLLDAGGPDAAGWRPTRPVPVPGGHLLVEDGDPYRDCYGQPVAPRLEHSAARVLGRTLAEACRFVDRDVPVHAAALAGGLRAVVPLAPDQAGPLRSATARHAFGAVALTPDAAPEAIAVLLVHEWQHVKLGAALDLYDLVEPGHTTRIRVPWRPDPRPVEGVLQGVYAHLAVTQVWQARAAAGVSAHPDASAHAARFLAWTRDGADALLASRSLTVAGERFVERVRQALEETGVGSG
ncbi:FxsB family cyclophane-forming radical SAM/SPASM peptide maturase [Micromonospora sp. WMMD710]|uniref:FxsB family cyclophane-forming radical SAM/SPASM peptide maturase n=1 Tax=Micromonospora sp. WMMD710 TaxID=3016085 RepID=UPI002415E681|nr:FxsB family cyclophane-forming radical SAM/SPASM peptide maturase [Micromonospora sp. WMMD710]MDG4759426.1 FxsB family radical SAM/SPASM domain protein [Micromonospora sp. WMMD710]